MRASRVVLFLLFLASPQRIAALNVSSNIPYATPADALQVLDLYTPDGAKKLPVVFWIHGGGWRRGDKADVQIKPRVFTERGFVFVSTNYRLLPQVDMDALTRDVARSLGWVHKTHVQLSANLGLPEDPATKELFKFLAPLKD